MILIADSGSTKTDWCCICDKKIVVPFKSAGLNPYFVDRETVFNEVSNSLPEEFESDKITEVFFYGAGCKVQEKKVIIKDGLSGLFTRARIMVETDILGAARALFGNDEGIALILGTGANSCVYAKGKVIQTQPSLGYVLGDEGSGAYLGLKLIKYWLNDELPADLKSDFDKLYTVSKDEVINAVYKEFAPNRFLASFTRFLTANIEHKFVYELCYSSFDELFEKNICKYRSYQSVAIKMAGSIAFYFKGIIEDVAKAKGAKIVEAIESPIDRLVGYHANSVT